MNAAQAGVGGGVAEGDRAGVGAGVVAEGASLRATGTGGPGAGVESGAETSGVGLVLGSEQVKTVKQDPEYLGVLVVVGVVGDLCHCLDGALGLGADS